MKKIISFLIVLTIGLVLVGCSSDVEKKITVGYKLDQTADYDSHLNEFTVGQKIYVGVTAELSKGEDYTLLIRISDTLSPEHNAGQEGALTNVDEDAEDALFEYLIDSGQEYLFEYLFTPIEVGESKVHVTINDKDGKEIMNYLSTIAIINEE
jgi:hypothetical protein